VLKQDALANLRLGQVNAAGRFVSIVDLIRLRSGEKI
jgi:hypothetical protein